VNTTKKQETMGGGLPLGALGFSIGGIGLKTASNLVLGLSFLVIFLFTLFQLSLDILMAYLIFGGVGFLIAPRKNQTGSCIYLIVFGLATVSSAGLYLNFESIHGVPYWKGGSDEHHFEEMGKEFATYFNFLEYGEIRRSLVPSWHNSVGYIYLNGLMTKFSQVFGGEHTMVPRLFNVACLGVIATLVFRLGDSLALRRDTAISAALFTGCLPLMMFMSGHTLRDIPICMLLLALVLIWTFDRAGRPRYSMFGALVFSLLLYIPLAELRLAQAYVGMLIVAMGLLARYNSHRFGSWFFGIILVGGVCIWTYVQVGILFSSNIARFIESAGEYSIYRTSGIIGGGLSMVVFETPPPLGWILRTAYALVSPFPELNTNLYQVWLNLGTAVQSLFIPFVFFGYRMAIWNRRWWVVLSAFTLLFIGMAMFTFQIRHIVQYLPFAVLIAAFGYEQYRGRHGNVFAVMIGLGGLLAIGYLILKLM
jgi:hypothetical protein